MSNNNEAFYFPGFNLPLTHHTCTLIEWLSFCCGVVSLCCFMMITWCDTINLFFCQAPSSGTSGIANAWRPHEDELFVDCINCWNRIQTATWHDLRCQTTIPTCLYGTSIMLDIVHRCVPHTTFRVFSIPCSGDTAFYFPVQMIWFFFSIHLILPVAYGPEVDSASNRIEYQESSRGINRDRRVRLTNSQPSVTCLENVGFST
jgi:hypothetical protein